MKALFTALLAMPFILGSCTKDEAVNPELAACEDNFTYTGHIQQIVNLNCTFSGCHDAAAVNSGIPMTSYADLKAIALQPRFLLAIRHEAGAQPMPRSNPFQPGSTPLPSGTIDTLVCWVLQGAPEN